MLNEPRALEHGQRVQVDLEYNLDGRCVKIRTESYDEGLGWYTSGALSLPLHQLPLLEQAVDQMRRSSREEEPFGQIIRFPGLAAQASA